jgi:hypothetical protein
VLKFLKRINYSYFQFRLGAFSGWSANCGKTKMPSALPSNLDFISWTL